MKWIIYADESGDAGFPVKGNSSHIFTVSLILVNDEKKDRLCELLQQKKKIVHPRGGALEWKRLTSVEKRSDHSLHRFFYELNDEGTDLFLPLTIIVDKDELYPDSVRSSTELIRRAYEYGFKILHPFLSKRKDTAEVLIDRNSCVEVQKALKDYVCGTLPLQMSLKYNTLYQINPSTNYSEPIFGSRKSEPCHQIADFFAGYARAAFEHCPRVGREPYIYKQSWMTFYSLHHRKIRDWNWNGLIYHPYDSRDHHKLLGIKMQREISTS